MIFIYCHANQVGEPCGIFLRLIQIRCLFSIYHARVLINTRLKFEENVFAFYYRQFIHDLE